MRIVDMDKPGVTLKISPGYQHEAFEAVDDDGKHIRLVGGQVVKVDELNQELQNKVNEGVLTASSAGEQGEDFGRLHNHAHITNATSPTETAASDIVDVNQDTTTHPERY